MTSPSSPQGANPQVRVAELEELNTRLEAEAERLRVKLDLADKACTALARKLDAAEGLNTPLVARVAALEKRLSDGRDAWERYRALTGRLDIQEDDIQEAIRYAEEELDAALRLLPSESQPAQAPGVDVTAADNVSIRKL